MGNYAAGNSGSGSGITTYNGSVTYTPTAGDWQRQAASGTTSTPIGSTAWTWANRLNTAANLAGTLACPVSNIQSWLNSQAHQNAPTGGWPVLTGLDDWVTNLVKQGANAITGGACSPATSPAFPQSSGVATLDPDIMADLDEILAAIAALPTPASATALSAVAAQVSAAQVQLDEYGRSYTRIDSEFIGWAGTCFNEHFVPELNSVSSLPNLLDVSRTDGETTHDFLARVLPPLGWSIVWGGQVGRRGSDPVYIYFCEGPNETVNGENGHVQAYWIGDIYGTHTFGGGGASYANPMFAAEGALSSGDASALDSFSFVGVSLGGLLAALVAAMPSWGWTGGTDGHFAHGVAPTSGGVRVWCAVLDSDVDGGLNYAYTPSSGPPKRSVKGDEIFFFGATNWKPD